MQANLLLEDLTKGVLQEIGKLGLCSELNRQYRRAYDRLKEFARYCQFLWMRKSASFLESSCHLFQLSVHEPPSLHHEGDLLITH